MNTRKIKFRGKRIDDREWVHGSYTSMRENNRNNPLCQVESKIFHRIWQWEAGDWNMGGYANYEVIPETVGRLIGKKDIKDIPIYEGDIFKFKFMEEPNKPIELIGSFAWNDEDLSYEIDIYSNEYPEYVCLHYIGNGQMYDFEIIGNIHDNPELLTKIGRK